MKKTLIVIDMQNDFIDGALGTEEAVKILPRVKAKIDEYRAEGGEIIFTRDTHGEDYLETSEGKRLPVPHCVKGTHGWEISPLLSTDGRTVIDKPTFGFTGWGAYAFEQIELIGVCTDICVVSNALILKATFPSAEITVDAACCAGVTVESHLAALTTMQACQITVTNL